MVSVQVIDGIEGHVVNGMHALIQTPDGQVLSSKYGNTSPV